LGFHPKKLKETMEKKIIFDTGPIISLTMNNLLWIIEPLKKQYNGEFIITSGVYSELVEKPLSTKKYKFEALQILPFITQKIIQISKSKEIYTKANELLELANRCFMAHENWIKIVHIAEMEALAEAINTNADAIVIDERTTRTLIESPNLLKIILERKLHTKIKVNETNLTKLKQEIGSLLVIRSFELVAMAFELGLLDRYMQKEEKEILPNLERTVLEGVLWAVKLNGCSVKREDIYTLIKMELGK
jgi:predicted nucleic acid-binding protein